MASAAILGGLAVLALVLVATMLSVTFATRAAMATNRPVIEVLHFIGAKNSFIAEHFQRHFLRLGLQGRRDRRRQRDAAVRAGRPRQPLVLGPAAGNQFVALFGTFSIGRWAISPCSRRSS